MLRSNNSLYVFLLFLCSFSAGKEGLNLSQGKISTNLDEAVDMELFLSHTAEFLNFQVFLIHFNPRVSANSQPGSEASSDSSEDVDYMPEEDRENKKVIQVGHDYQAPVPEGFCHYGDAPPYENEDRLLWNPSKIEEDNCEFDYLFLLFSLSFSLSVSLSTPSQSMSHFSQLRSPSEIGIVCFSHVCTPAVTNLGKGLGFFFFFPLFRDIFQSNAK